MSNTAGLSIGQLFSENWESVEGLQQYKDSIKEEIWSELLPGYRQRESVSISKPPNLPTTSKIVKHIRGGGKGNYLSISLMS